MHTYSIVLARVLQQRMHTVYERMHITTLARLELLYAYYDVGEESINF